MHISRILGREIFDSRGWPTVEADVILSNGIIGRASVPSGASTGIKEAYELRDNDLRVMSGRGVKKAVSAINFAIHNHLKDQNIANQEIIDEKLIALDGTENKSNIGANAILAVSLACARAQANYQQLPLFVSLNKGENMTLPMPMMNILNGGAHADNNVDIQEFMIIPRGASNLSEALQIGAGVYHSLKSILKKLGLATSVGDEGGYAPNLASNKQALELLCEAVEKAGLRLQKDVVFSLDVAASELFENKKYLLEGRSFCCEELIEYYESLVKDYPIVSIEDGMAENDWEAWAQLTKALGAKIQLVGDDLFVTNTKYLQQGIDEKIANAVLVKVNQVGTLTQARQTINLARANNYNCIMSHRSGETEDTFIADLSVATGCDQIKTGAMGRSERVAKYNQLLRINEIAALPLKSLF